MRTTGLNLFFVWMALAAGTITSYYLFGAPVTSAVMVDRIITEGWTIGVVWIDLVLLNRK